VTAGQRYLTGLVLVAIVGFGLVFLLPGEMASKLTAVTVGVVVQGPLGWWLVKSVGTPRFLQVWPLGILARFAVLGLVALVVFPAFHWPLSPGLLLLGGVLVALLFLEALVAWLKTGAQPRAPTEAR
jgi:hypothetical protein